MATQKKPPAAKSIKRRASRKKDQAHVIDLNPDERAITLRQAAYLADITRVEGELLVGKRLGDLGELLEWRIDRFSLFYRKVCGRVVKTDAATGIVHGVPGATVHVMDTDCSFLGYFPVEHPNWWWLWLINCKEEEIATTVTDECGNFCVWIPRWDIDRLLRWRKERICLPEVYRPNLGDLVAVLDRPPFPQPPEPPFDREHLVRAAEVMGSGIAGRVELLAGDRAFGSVDAIAPLLELPAFGAGEFPPPLTPEAVERLDVLRYEKIPQPYDSLALGPFFRCHDIFVPEWTTIFDIPDINFKVTQDVDEDDDEETIYDEGIFDVRWNAGDIPNVVLEAWPGARVSHICDGPDIPCETVPSIETVGLMPLQPSHHDADGYSTRVNRPRPSGLSTGPQAPGESAQAPYAGTLQLHGCHHIAGKSFYRLVYRHRPTLTGTLTSEVPFTALSWWAPRIGTGPVHVVPDADGWYPILNAPDMVFPHWLLNWPTTSFPHGQYEVRLQVANAAKAAIVSSAPIAFVVDNRSPNAGFTQLRWRVGGSPTWETLPAVCPVIDRPTGSKIEIEASWYANAVHFRNALLTAGGCGSSSPVRLDGPPPASPSDFDHWHTGDTDNSIVRVGIFEIPAGALAGCYSLAIDAHTRAFNPAGDGGGPGTNWLENYAYSHLHPSVSVSVVDV